MICFYKFSIQLKPQETALEMFAPSWEEAGKTESYQRLLAEQQPRSLRIIQQQYGYHDGTVQREATPEEIGLWTRDDAYLRMPQIEAMMEDCFYQYLGDERILAPLREKLEADHNESLAIWRSWKNEYGHNGKIPMEQIGGVCLTETAYRNLLNCGGGYPQEYMQVLLEEEHPLWTAAFLYDQSGRFDRERGTNELLETLVCSQKALAESKAIETQVEKLSSHAEKMELLDSNLDREYLALTKEWNGWDFDTFLSKATEVYTLWQLYYTLRYEKEKYPTEQLDVIAQLKNPITYDKDHLIGQREICAETIGELKEMLPLRYPDVIPEPDIWNMPDTDQEDGITLTQ